MANRFPRVREAREALSAKAVELVDAYIATIAEARAAGHFEEALDHMQWLIEHMAAQDGVRLIDPSAAKVKEVAAGPTHSVQIGIALGGVKPTQALPPKVIDITDKE